MRSCAIAVVLVWAAIIQIAGCYKPSGWPGEKDTGGTAGTGGTSSCDAECAPVPGWLGPSVFAIGPSGDTPACTHPTPRKGIELHDSPSALPLSCPVCQCEPSETTCSVPTEWHASAAKCSDTQSGQITPFPASAGWPGTCTTENAVPAGALCGGVPCVQSVTVQPPSITAAPCAPKLAGGSAPPHVEWALRARQCLPEDPAACPAEPPACLPENDLSMCVYRDGDLPCPGPPYTDRHRLFRTSKDQRSCSPCSCAPPAGNGCIVFVTAYSDAGCDTVAGAINVVSGDGESCFDVPAGFSLAAKSAEIVAAPPGSCAPSGSEPTGTIAPALPVTICCREEVVPG